MGTTLGTAKDFSVETLLLFAVVSRTAGGVGDADSTDAYSETFSQAEKAKSIQNVAKRTKASNSSPESTSLATPVLHCPQAPPRRHLQQF